MAGGDTRMQAIATRDQIDSASLTGVSIGALICAFFGAGWMFWAVAWSGRHPQIWLFYVLDAVSLTMLGLAILGIRRAVRIHSSQPKEQPSWRPPRGLYWLNTGTEWFLVAGAAVWLSHIGRSDLIPEVCGLIVGLHFFPLAAIFGAPIYYGTGAAMLIGEAASFMLPRGYARNVVGCGTVGLALWATAAVLLARVYSARSAEMKHSAAVF
jgi:hypothetical protein